MEDKRTYNVVSNDNTMIMIQLPFFLSAIDIVEQILIYRVQ